jgi:hypothetical protein
MLIRSLNIKNKEDKGVTNLDSDFIRKYIGQSGVCNTIEEYNIVSLIVPRPTKVSIDIILIS